MGQAPSLIEDLPATPSHISHPAAEPKLIGRDLGAMLQLGGMIFRAIGLNPVSFSYLALRRFVASARWRAVVAASEHLARLRSPPVHNILEN